LYDKEKLGYKSSESSYNDLEAKIRQKEVQPDNLRNTALGDKHPN
jgi:hypothetical protein